MHCGCPTPIREQTQLGRLAGAMSRLNLSRMIQTLDLVPPQIPDALAATHVSEHNAFLMRSSTGGFSSDERAVRASKLRHWIEEEEKKCAEERGKLPPRQRNSDHDIASLSAPPLFALEGPPLAVCTAVASSNDNGNAGSVRAPALLLTMYTF